MRQLAKRRLYIIGPMCTFSENVKLSKLLCGNALIASRPMLSTQHTQPQFSCNTKCMWWTNMRKKRRVCRLMTWVQRHMQPSQTLVQANHKGRRLLSVMSANYTRQFISFMCIFCAHVAVTCDMCSFLFSLLTRFSVDMVAASNAHLVSSCLFNLPF